MSNLNTIDESADSDIKAYEQELLATLPIDIRKLFARTITFEQYACPERERAFESKEIEDLHELEAQTREDIIQRSGGNRGTIRLLESLAINFGFRQYHAVCDRLGTNPGEIWTNFADDYVEPNKAAGRSVNAIDYYKDKFGITELTKEEV